MKLRVAENRSRSVRGSRDASLLRAVGRGAGGRVAATKGDPASRLGHAGDDATCYQRHLPVSARSAFKTARLVAAFVAGLVGGAVAINLTITRTCWQPYTSRLDDKLAELERLGDRVDVLFIGSSHYARGIIPAEFDACMLEMGERVFSYNLSVDNLSHVEQKRLLEYLSQNRLRNLKVVFFECEFRGTPEFRNLANRRTRYTYDWSNAPEAIQFKLFSRRPFATRVGAMLSMSAALGLHALNLGVLADVMMPDEVRQPAESRYRWGRQGWDSYLSTMSEDQYRRAEEAFLATYQRRGGFRLFANEDLEPPRNLTAVETEIVGRQLARAASLGGRVAILTLPRNRAGDRSRSVHRVVAERWPEIPIFSYLRVSPEDEFYLDPSLWFDFNHFSEEGARRFAKRLARDTAPLIRNERLHAGTER